MLAADEYEFIRQRVYDRSRINLGSDKAEWVSRRLHKRARVAPAQQLFDQRHRRGRLDSSNGSLLISSSGLTPYHL